MDQVLIKIAVGRASGTDWVYDYVVKIQYVKVPSKLIGKGFIFRFGGYRFYSERVACRDGRAVYIPGIKDKFPVISASYYRNIEDANLFAAQMKDAFTAMNAYLKNPALNQLED